MKSLFKGVGVALVTPLYEGEIDYLSTKFIIEKNLKEGASAFIILATTGEGELIKSNARTEFIKFCKSIIQNKAKIIIGTGNINFDKCMQNTLLAKQLGCDGALIVTPYYTKTSQSGIVEFYHRLSKLEFPIIMYNIPTRTGLNIELSTIKKILKSNPFIYGIKECSSNISRIENLCSICKNKIPVYCGEDSLNFVYYCLGASGCISVTANALCKDVNFVYQNHTTSPQTSLEKQRYLAQINQALFIETNPIPIKYLLYKLNYIKSDEINFPLIKLNKKYYKLLNKIKNKYF